MQIHKIKLSGLLLISTLLLLSCHSEHLHTNYSIHHSAEANPDSTKLAFFLSRSAYYPASGISRFPDGGMSDERLSAVDLYVYNIVNEKLTRIMSFDDLTEVTGNSRAAIDSDVLWYNDSLIFSIAPVSDWSFYLNHSESDSKKAKIRKLKESHALAYVYADAKISRTDSSSLPQKSQGVDVKLGDIRKTLENLPAKTIGFDIRKLTDRSDKQLIRECILAENESPLTRRAIAEQIIIPKGNETIQDCIHKIEEHKRDLSGIDKKLYVSRIAPVENRLRIAMLQSGHTQ